MHHDSTADMSETTEEIEEDSDAGDSGAVDTGPVAGGTLRATPHAAAARE